MRRGVSFFRFVGSASSSEVASFLAVGVVDRCRIFDRVPPSSFSAASRRFFAVSERIDAAAVTVATSGVLTSLLILSSSSPSSSAVSIARLQDDVVGSAAGVLLWLFLSGSAGVAGVSGCSAVDAVDVVAVSSDAVKVCCVVSSAVSCLVVSSAGVAVVTGAVVSAVGGVCRVVVVVSPGCSSGSSISMLVDPASSLLT